MDILSIAVFTVSVISVVFSIFVLKKLFANRASNRHTTEESLKPFHFEIRPLTKEEIKIEIMRDLDNESTYNKIIQNVKDYINNLQMETERNKNQISEEYSYEYSGQNEHSSDIKLLDEMWNKSKNGEATDTDAEKESIQELLKVLENFADTLDKLEQKLKEKEEKENQNEQKEN